MTSFESAVCVSLGVIIYLLFRILFEIQKRLLRRRKDPNNDD